MQTTQTHDGSTIPRYLLAMLCVVLLAACGDEREEQRGSDRAVSRPGATPATDADARLEVVVEQVGGKAVEGGGSLPVPALLQCNRRLPATCRGTIRCPAAEDTPPAEARVCGWLATDGAAALVEEEPEDMMCTEQYGGPEVARVTGRLGGEPVDATFTRTDGCQISRYDRAAPLWTGEVPTSDGAAPAGGGEPPIEPEVIDDPPEAFER